jgi:hypothetical protein
VESRTAVGGTIDSVGYAVLAQATMVVHFAFLAYLTLGGYLAWRWRWTIWLHLAVVGWGVSIITIGQECPLTYVENWARRAAGEHDLAGGFINTYLTGVVYPPAYLTEVRVAVALLVAVSWAGWARLGTRRVSRDGRR